MKLIRTGVVIALAGMMAAGCASAPRSTVDTAFQHKVVTACENDLFCVRSNYSVAWDSLCNSVGCDRSIHNRLPPAYPITYRSNEYIIETGSNGYPVPLPPGGTARIY
jgi:hypothetical protein